MITFLEIVLYIIIITILHEFGHFCAAKALLIPIDKYGFKLKPYPSFYIEIYEINLPIYKRILFLISGNLATIINFTICLILGFSNPAIYYAFALQLSNEINPFHSDYQTLLFSLVCKKDIDDSYHSDNPEGHIKQIYNDKYYLSIFWILHFTLWGISTAFLIKYLIIR